MRSFLFVTLFQICRVQRCGPTVVVNSAQVSKDILAVALTSKTGSLLSGEFILSDWARAGLNVETAVKRGIFTIHEKHVLKTVGTLLLADIIELDTSLRCWFDL